MLYAERNAADIDLTRRHLSRVAPHIELTVVGDAGAALACLPEGKDVESDFDVVLLDYRLPGLDALDVVKILRTTRGLDIPIVMVTGQGTETVAAQAIHLGVDDYIVKHASYVHELPATIEKVHRQSQLAREQSNLRATTERLSQVLATSPVVLYTLCLGAQHAACTWVSRNVESLIGYPPEVALEAGWWQAHLHPDDRDHAMAAMATLQQAESLAHEYRFIDGKGVFAGFTTNCGVWPPTRTGPSNSSVRGMTSPRPSFAEQLRETRVAVLDGVMSTRPSMRFCMMSPSGSNGSGPICGFRSCCSILAADDCTLRRRQAFPPSSTRR